jgi:SAM-dependent methyltransferase
LNENHISCTICKGASFGEFTFKNLTLCRCTHCGHRFTRHDSLENPKEYDEEYYLSEHKNWFNNPNIELFDKVYSLINQKPQQDFSVLDVGCGKCDLLKYFKSKSNSLKLYGIDLSPNEPQEGIEFIKGISYQLLSALDLI